ncbi:hypothetical protein BOTBODRAFT_114438 [Botryobasidium botryosum FD-172 SS1]|uniref:AB hydrolase-1 domain-containing protein n=1 Tax=Botryobasidium botryosum (strain FD-172 SS1) TaxID=930990 RepID=A0A067M6Q9_BOTB1|nr:hypothetical protein BOTBODRAFT_114438 [Botryobasidium botryosum FD-172 SS1]
MEAPPNRGFLAHAHTFLVCFGGLYALFLVPLATPVFQRNVVYLHNVRWPINANFNLPEKYGLPPFKTVNFNMTTSDDVRLGAWLVLSDQFYQSHTASAVPTVPFTDAEVQQALTAHPTVLFFHGNAGNRAFGFRVASYSALSSRGANVLVIDYRGFGDSEGYPSKEGLGKDARAAWDWLSQRGVEPQNVLIMGHSLGTAVSSMLAAELSSEQITPRGLVLAAPFTSMFELVETYSFGGVVPVLGPMRTFPWVMRFIKRFIQHPFDTASIITTVKSPILLVHAKDDSEIIPTHSSNLFSALLEPHLPPFPFTPKELLDPSFTQSRWSEIQDVSQRRKAATEQLVKNAEVEGLGQLREFEREGAGKVVHLETIRGGHNDVVNLEGVIDLLEKETSFGRLSV